MLKIIVIMVVIHKMEKNTKEKKVVVRDKRIILIYLLVFLVLIIGFAYALNSNSIAINTNTALIGIDESAYGNTSFDSADLDFKPILDSDVETSLNNVIKINFAVGGAETNNADNIIYDIALNDLDVNCSLLSSYIKWKLLKNGTEISNGSLDYKFDTIKDGRLVLTNIQQDLPNYNATDKSGYDQYTFYMWFSDSCQSSDLSSCIGKADQSTLMEKSFSGKIEVELYTGSKKALTRDPSTSLDGISCSVDPERYTITYNLDNCTVNHNPTTYTVATPTFSLVDPGCAGYTFTGWTGSNGDTPSKSIVIPQGSTGNLTYTANATPNDYTVTFDVNGGDAWTSSTCTGTDFSFDSSTSACSKTVTYGSNYGTFPIPTKSGYPFAGWYTTSTGGTQVEENTQIEPNDVTYYALWGTVNKVIIQYRVNSGSWAGLSDSTFAVDSSGYVTKGGSRNVQSITYGSSSALYNYNNSSGINITRSGYVGKPGAEWVCSSGCTTSNKTFNQDTVYKSTDYCDASNGDCTIVLDVNWIAPTISISSSKSSGTYTPSQCKHTYSLQYQFSISLNVGSVSSGKLCYSGSSSPTSHCVNYSSSGETGYGCGVFSSSTSWQFYRGSSCAYAQATSNYSKSAEKIHC